MPVRTIGVLATMLMSLAAVFAQDRSGVIQLLNADELKGRTISGAEVRELLGNVRFLQYLKDGGVVRVWSDRALQFIAAERLELDGQVRVRRDSVTITADAGQYFGTSRRVDMAGNVRLIRTGSVLTSEFGEYYPDEKRAVFTGAVEVRDSVSRLRCDRLEYFETDDRSIATGNVSVVQFSDGTTVFGDSLVNFDREGRSIVEKNPRLMQIDSSAGGTVDTFLVESDRMESLEQPENRMIALGNVRMARSNLSATCRGAVFHVDEDRITLTGEPVVWHEGNQLTGDSIFIMVRERRLNRVRVRGHGMAVSRADSVRKARFDQLSGRYITMFFSEGRVNRIEVDETATSLYYLYDGGIPNGMNISSGNRIIIGFDDGVTDQITVIGGVLGSYYPERLISYREADYNLDGFRWIRTRPVREGMRLVFRERE